VAAASQGGQATKATDQPEPAKAGGHPANQGRQRPSL